MASVVRNWRIDPILRVWKDAFWHILSACCFVALEPWWAVGLVPALLLLVFRYFSSKCKNDIAGDVNNMGAGTLTHQLFLHQITALGQYQEKAVYNLWYYQEHRFFRAAAPYQGRPPKGGSCAPFTDGCFPLWRGRHSPFVGHHRDYKYKYCI